ncbi:MAG: prepilin-type N-terminal cleavage/methylation domain-containing protein [Elusimicrobiota bacterium]
MGASARRRGFTLAELMFAIAIFSMVMAGLGAIYVSSLRQSVSISGEARLKSMAVLAMHAVRSEVVVATRIDSPVEGGTSDVLIGGRNVARDGMNPMDGIAGDTRWFGFCVRYTPIGACGSSLLDPTPCIFYYSGAGWPPPAVGAGNCGSPLGGATPMLVASGLNGPANGAPNYFSRQIAFKAANWNQVRFSFRLTRAATGASQVLNYSGDSTFNGQFSRYQ